MSALKSMYRSRLPAAKVTELLKKIRLLSTERSSRFVLIFKDHRFKGEELTSFTIDETLATGTLLLNAGGRYGVTAASEIIEDLTYTAKKVGDYYANDVRIKYVNPGAVGALSVSVTGHDITVTLAHNGSAVTSTANDIKAAIEALAAANALVSIVVSGVGTDVQSAVAFTALAGGSNQQSFDKANIAMIRRLRTKKWAIELKSDANPA